jgi:DNA-binding LacI/PurR family transcriptional regulator
MADVARLAGVSHQTVSRVINDSDRVAPGTRDRVLEAMRLLEYRPNSVARALVTGRSRTVGVIGFNTTLFGPASTLFGIERSAHEADYLTSVVSMPEFNRDSVLLAVERLRRHNVEGVLALAAESSAIAALAPVSRELSLVALEAEPVHGIPTVAIDQYGGAVSATRHLLELGHRRIAHIAGPAGSLEVQLRLAGCRDTLAEAGLQLPAPEFGDWSAGSGYELGVHVAADPEITAIFVANDQMALGALRALDEAGRRVPDDVSIVGFDAIPESEFFTPPLTTIHQDFVEIGRRGFELLLRRIGDPDSLATHQVIGSKLVVRASTAPPPARGR